MADETRRDATLLISYPDTTITDRSNYFSRLDIILNDTFEYFSLVAYITLITSYIVLVNECLAFGVMILLLKLLLLPLYLRIPEKHF